MYEFVSSIGVRADFFKGGGAESILPEKNHFARPWGGLQPPPPAHTPLVSSSRFYFKCVSADQNSQPLETVFFCPQSPRHFIEERKQTKVFPF